MRLFVAVKPGDEMLGAIKKARNLMRDMLPYARFTREDNFHITLAFLGEVAPSRLAQCERALENVSFSPFDISLGGYGCFSDVLWLGLERSEALKTLAERTRRALTCEGLEIDKKPFRAHITLARQANVRGMVFPEAPKAKSNVSEIILMESRREYGKLIYDPVYTVKAK